MSYETIDLGAEGGVATIRLHRPERMNAVNEEMYREIQAALNEIRDDSALRCVVLTGSVLVRDGVEKQAFCAGADLKRHAAGERTTQQRREYLELAHRTARAIWELPRPVIAAINGPARGAGAELALACDLILIAETASLAFPETGLGTFVGGGATHLLPRLVGLARARELVYTGRVVGGRQAVELGLASACHPLARLLPEALALARTLAKKAPIPLALAKRHLGDSKRDLDEALRTETEAILRCMETDDWREGLRAFQEKREPRYTGS